MRGREGSFIKILCLGWGIIGTDCTDFSDRGGELGICYYYVVRNFYKVRKSYDLINNNITHTK